MGIEDQIRTIIQEEFDELKQFISKQLSSQKDPDERRYLTRSQMAKYLSIGVSTVDYWSKTGKLRKVQIKGQVRFDKVEVDASIQQGVLSRYSN